MPWGWVSMLSKAHVTGCLKTGIPTPSPGPPEWPTSTPLTPHTHPTATSEPERTEVSLASQALAGGTSSTPDTNPDTLFLGLFLPYNSLAF